MSYPGDDDSGSMFGGNDQINPDAIQRQLALATALQQQSQRINPGAYGGLNSAIQNIGGALLGHYAQNAQAKRYADVMKSLFGDGQQTQAPPQPSQASEVASGQLDPEGNPLVSTAPPPPPQASTQGPLASALGPSRAKLYAALMQAEGPEAGMAGLPKMVEDAANRQQAMDLYSQFGGQQTPGSVAGASAPPAPMPGQAGPVAANSQPSQTMGGLRPDQQLQLRMAAASGNPAEVTKVLQSFYAPKEVGGVLYGSTGGGYTPLINPKHVIDLTPQQMAQIDPTFDPRSVAPSTVLEYNPTEGTMTPKKAGDTYSPTGMSQRAQLAAIHAQAALNVHIDPDALAGAVSYFKANGALPPNARSPAMQQAVLAAIQNEGQGGGAAFGQGVDTKIGVHARSGAATNLAKQQALTQVNEDAVNGAGNILNGLLAKGVAGPTNITGINDLIVWGKQHTNDPDAANLVNGINAYSNEFARVMTGATTGAPSSDRARDESAQRILHGYNTGTMQAVMAQMNQEMANKTLAQRGALGQATHGTYTGVTPTIQYNNPNNQRLSPQDAAKLPPGTPFVGLDGVSRIKH